MIGITPRRTRLCWAGSYPCPNCKLQIQLGSRILLYADDVQTTFDIYEKVYDSDGHFLRYKHMGKQAVILPYANDNKFIVIGVLQE